MIRPTSVGPRKGWLPFLLVCYTPKPYNLPPPAIPAVPYNDSGFGRILTGKLTKLGHTVFSGVYLEKSVEDLRIEVRRQRRKGERVPLGRVCC